MYIYIYIYTHVYTYIYAYIHTHIYAMSCMSRTCSACAGLEHATPSAPRRALASPRTGAIIFMAQQTPTDKTNTSPRDFERKREREQTYHSPSKYTCCFSHRNCFS